MKQTALVDKDGKVRLRDTGGEPVAVPQTDLPFYFEQGFTLETPEQGAIREQVDANKGLQGQLKVAGNQFTNQLLLGLPQMIRERTDDPLQVAIEEAIRKENNVANVLGGIGGFGTSLLVGGPVFKGVAKVGQGAERAVQKLFTEKLAEQGIKKGAKGIASKMAAKTVDNVAKYGTEGIIYSSPYAVTEAVLADPDGGYNLAAESLAAGGLLGAGLGIVAGGFMPAMRLTGQMGKAVTKPIVDPIKRYLDPKRAAVSLYNPTPTELRKFTNKHGKDFQEELLGLTKKIGVDLGTVNPEEFLPKVQQYLDDSVTKLNDLARTSKGTISSRTVGQDIVKELKDINKTFSQGVGGEGNVKQVNKIIKEINRDFIKVDRPITAGELLDLKRATSQNITFTKNPMQRTAQEDALNKAVKKFDFHIGEIVQKNNPEMANIWRRQNKEVSMLIDVIEPLKRKAGRDINRPFAGVGNVVPVAGAAYVGGPLGVAAGMALSPAFRDQRAFGILYAENALKKIGKALDTIPTAIKAQVEKAKKSAPDSLTKYKREKALFTGIRLGNTQEDRIEEYERIRDRIIEFSEDPAYASNQLAPVLALLSDTGAPGIASAYAHKNALMAKYFGSQVPKSNRINMPYYKPKYIPSDTELSRFERKLRVMQNPFSVIEDFERGDLTSESVETLKTVYPEIFKRMQQKIVETLMDTEVPYETRLQLSLLLEAPTDPSLENIATFQQTFQPQEAPQRQQGIKVPNIETDVTRISNK